MIPKVDFQVHEVLIQAFFLPKKYGGDRAFLDSKFKEFIELFSSMDEKILTLIEKYSGFEWAKEKIPVFFVPDNQSLPYSFTKSTLQEDFPGIVMKIRPNAKFRDFFIFIHELCHVNQFHSDFHQLKYRTITENNTINTDVSELSADLVTLYILRDLFGKDSEYEKDFWDFLKNTNEKNKKKYDEMEKYMPIWDLNKNPLRIYLEQ